MTLNISGSTNISGSLTVQHQVVPPAFVAVRGQLGAGSSNAASAPIAVQPWSTTTLPSSAGWLDNGLVYGNGVYMVVSFDGLCFITSDGVTWTQGGNLPARPANHIWQAIAYGNRVFLATSFQTTGSSSTFAARSTDNGQTWSSVTLSRGFSSTTYVAYGNGTFLVMPSLSDTGTASFLLAYSTDDGQTWTNTTAFYGIYNQVRSTSPVYVNNRFVMLYSITNVFTSQYIVRYLTSTDGNTWVNTNPGIPEQPYQTTGSLITNGTNFVINPSSGFYSTDGGNSWSQAANRFSDMTYNSTANIFVALASDGSVFYSDSANIAANIWTSAGNITGSASTYWNNIATYDPNI